MKSIKVFTIIHLFAVLHAIVAFLCRLAEVPDELLLTLLTILMTVLISLHRRLNIEFTAALVIVVNVLGYLLGTGGAALFEQLITNELALHALSTFLTTELLGCSIAWFTKIFSRGDGSPAEDYLRPDLWTPRIWMLLLAVGLIFVSRLAYIELFTHPSYSSGRVYAMIDRLLSNSIAIILLICLNIICVRHMQRHSAHPAVKITLLLLFFFISSAAVALIVELHLPLAFDNDFSMREFLQMLSITLLVEVVFYSVFYMVAYAIAARELLRAERDKTHQAQFRYMNLKQQLNPHFLFNSLNILDCLVCEKQTGQASAYIHKLAGIYRYMLQNEEEPTVRLGEELAFVEMYVDLLKVRFADGFDVKVDIPEEAMRRNVVPCSVQLLIENAIKHNIVGSDSPLRIAISAAGNSLTVTNTLRPKLSGVSSTRVGLNYIRQQYLDLANKPIEITATDSEYTVTLPLL